MLNPRQKSWAAGMSITLMAIALMLLFAFPFIWMIAACFKSNPEIFRPFPLLPESADSSAFPLLFSGEYIPFNTQFTLSLISTSLQTLAAVAISAGAGYVLGCFNFNLRRFLLVCVIATILIPKQVLAIPLMAWFHQLNILDNWWVIILPGALSGIGILYFTLMYRKLPRDLLDCARTEGASEWKVFTITLPLLAPSLITYALIHFIFAWQEHVLPLALLHSESQMTATLGLSSLYGSDSRFPYSLLMAGSTIIVIPTVMFFLITRRWFFSALEDLTSPGGE